MLKEHIILLALWLLFISHVGAFNPRLSQKEKYENIAIKNRFRYEDIKIEKILANDLKEMEGFTNKIEEVINDLEEIDNSLDSIIDSERRHQSK